MNTHKTTSLLAGLALASTLASGCFTTRIVTGAPPATPSPMATDRWHHSVVMGIAEISDPVDLDALCPGGWAQIDEEQTFLNGFVSGATSGLYTPRTYTVVCTGGAAAAPPAPAEASPGME